MEDRLDFDAVEDVFGALSAAFHPDGMEGDIDPKFHALWTLFLVSAGWNEDEFWEACEDNEAECTCNGCDKVCPSREEDKPN